jgi:oligoribonuclease (3'-5' exoribonuclease)
LKEHCGVLKNSKLKTVAKALKKRGHIQSDWDDEMTSGMEANMVIIRGVQDKFVKFSEFPGIDRLIHYNMIDCMTLYEIVKYVRSQIE